MIKTSLSTRSITTTLTMMPDLNAQMAFVIVMGDFVDLCDIQRLLWLTIRAIDRPYTLEQ